MFNFFKKRPSNPVLNTNIQEEVTNKVTVVKEKINKTLAEKLIEFEHNSSDFDGNEGLHHKLLSRTDKVYTFESFVFNGVTYMSGEVFQILDIRKKPNTPTKKQIGNRENYQSNFIIDLMDVENRKLTLDLNEPYRPGVHEINGYTDDSPYDKFQSDLLDSLKPRRVKLYPLFLYKETYSNHLTLIIGQNHRGIITHELEMYHGVTTVYGGAYSESTLLDSTLMSLQELKDLNIFKFYRYNDVPDDHYYSWNEDKYVKNDDDWY